METAGNGPGTFRHLLDFSCIHRVAHSRASYQTHALRGVMNELTAINLMQKIAQFRAVAGKK